MKGQTEKIDHTLFNRSRGEKATPPSFRLTHRRYTYFNKEDTKNINFTKFDEQRS